MYEHEKQTIVRDFSLVSRDGHTIGLDIYKPHDLKPGSAVLLFVHGGGFIGGDKDQFLAMAPFIALEKGVVSITVEYRTDTPYPAAVFDVIEAIDWIGRNEKALSVDKNKLVVIGGSPGANIGLLAVNNEWRTRHAVFDDIPFHPHNLVLLNGIFSLKSLWNLNEDLQADLLKYLGDYSKIEDASPSNYVYRGFEILLLHGEEDRVVPFEEALSIKRKWEEEGSHVSIVSFKHEGHAWFNSLYKHVPVIKEITEFIDKLEKDK
jgi:Esterase/lipase